MFVVCPLTEIYDSCEELELSFNEIFDILSSQSIFSCDKLIKIAQYK